MMNMWVIKKEVMDGKRNFKFLIILAGFLFFAIFEPVMNKFVLPEILKSQFRGITPEMMNQMVDMTQRGSLRAYYGDVYQIGLLILVFTLCGLMAKEINEKTLIMPICSGIKYKDIILSKLIVFGSVAFIAILISTCVNYFYSSILFGFDLPSIKPVLKAGVLQGLYMIFVISILIFIGTITTKSIFTGVLTLILVYTLGFIGDLLNISRFLPSALINEAQLLVSTWTFEIYESIIITVGCIIIFTMVSIIRLKTMELTKR